MKTKYLWLGVGALLAVGGAWLARAAWRIQHQIVTLHVRDVPLGQVLRQIERQTWKKIYAEQALDARITLNVDNKPLASVLDRIAEQAGGQWSALYTVYQSPRALAQLEGALAGDGKLEPAGWTKLAPELPNLSQAAPPGYAAQPGQALQVEKLPPGFRPGATVTATEDTVVENKAAGDAKSDVAGSGLQRQPLPRVVHVVRKGAGDGDAQEEVWSPEELLAETALKTRLGQEPTPEDIPGAAVRVAQKLNAHWKTCIAFRKSAMGIGFGARPFRRFVRRGPGPQGKGANLENLQAQLPPPDLAEAARHQGNEAFERLTPQQRVLRAREFSAQRKIESQNSHENQ